VEEEREVSGKSRENEGGNPTGGGEGGAGTRSDEHGHTETATKIKGGVGHLQTDPSYYETSTQRESQSLIMGQAEISLRSRLNRRSTGKMV
jgi:hypothetical protein